MNHFSTSRILGLLAIGLFLLSFVPACSNDNSDAQDDRAQSLLVYSGRGEDLVQPLMEDLDEQTDFNIEVRYAPSTELAAQLRTEGEDTPADVFYAQDAGSLGAVAEAGLFATLPDDILNLVEPRFRSSTGAWVGVTGRARVINYNTNNVSEDELPSSIWDLTNDKWEGRVGWAPQNSSFQSFVTALRHVEGEDRARQWLEEMMDNNVQSYGDNTPIVKALNRGEIDIGLVNNYYLHQLREENENFSVGEHYTDGDAGSMINVSGIGRLAPSNKEEIAHEFIRLLLEQEAQQYFASETYEYPLIPGVEPPAGQRPLSEIETPDINLGNLTDKEQTTELLRDVGAM